MVCCVYSEEHLVRSCDPSVRYGMVCRVNMEDVKYLHRLHLKKSCMI